MTLCVLLSLELYREAATLPARARAMSERGIRRLQSAKQSAGPPGAQSACRLQQKVVLAQNVAMPPKGEAGQSCVSIVHPGVFYVSRKFNGPPVHSLRLRHAAQQAPR